MKRSWVGLILVIIEMMGFSAWGAPKKAVHHKKVAAEVYSATDENPGSTAAPSEVAPAPAGVVAPAGNFDIVPEQQRELIVRRLKLVEELLRRYGRAYDYRVHTVRELENTLARLESGARPAVAPTGVTAPTGAANAGSLAPVIPPAPPANDSDSDHGTAFVGPET